MNAISHTEDQIEFIEIMPVGMRVILFVFSLLPWLAPYEFFIEHRWTEFNLLTLFFALLSLGAVSVGLMFTLGAIFGVNQTLRFDRKTRTVLYFYESSVSKIRQVRYPFDAVAGIELYVYEWESRPETYGLEVLFKDKRRVKVGEVSEKAEMEGYIHTLQGWIQK
jgi:hypothetical protein